MIWQEVGKLAATDDRSFIPAELQLEDYAGMALADGWTITVEERQGEDPVASMAIAGVTVPLAGAVRSDGRDRGAPAREAPAPDPRR